MDRSFFVRRYRVALYILLICFVPFIGLTVFMPNVFAANRASYTSNINRWLGNNDTIAAWVTFTYRTFSSATVRPEMRLLNFSHPNCNGHATEISNSVQLSVPGNREQTRNIQFPIKHGLFTVTNKACVSFFDTWGIVNIPLHGTLRIDSRPPVRTTTDYFINEVKKNLNVHSKVNAGTRIAIMLLYANEGRESGLSPGNAGVARIRFGNGRWRNMSNGTVFDSNSRVRYSYTIAPGDDGVLKFSLTGPSDNAGNTANNETWTLNSIEADEPDNTTPIITFPGTPEVEKNYTINITDSQSGIYRYGALKISGSEDSTACDTYNEVSSGKVVEPGGLPKEVSYSYTVPNALSDKICVYAEDYSGNIRSAVSPAIAPQNTPPILTIINDIPNTWARSHGFTVRLSDVNPNDTLYLSYQQVETSAECLDNSTYNGTTPPTSFVVVPSPERGEEYTATFNTENHSGKYACFAASDGKSTTVQVSTNAMKIDTTSPALSISDPASGAAQSKSITPTVTDTNTDATGNRYVISSATCDEALIGSDGVGSAWTSGEAVVLKNEGYNGTYLCFRARDKAGNISFARSARINGIDRTGPSITTVGPGGGAARQKTMHATIDATAVTGSIRFTVSSEDCDESVIGSDTAGVNYTSGSVITLNREDENGSYICFRARDTLGNVSFARSAQIADIDRTNPVIGNIAVTTSGNVYGTNKYAKAGDDIVATTTVSDEHLTTLPVMRVFSESAAGGTGMTVRKTGEQGYIATYTVQSGDESKTPKKIHLEARDDAGNAGGHRVDIGVVIDTTRPVASATDYYINGTSDAAKKRFDGVVKYLPAGSTIIIERRYNNEVSASGFSSHSAGLWKVKFGDEAYRDAEAGTVEGAAAGHVRYPYTIQPGDNGVLRWSVTDLKDNAGNAAPDESQEIKIIEAETTPPTLSSVHATTNNEITTAAQAGDQITIQATVADQLSFSDNAVSRIAIHLDGETVTGTPIILSQDGANNAKIFQWVHTVVAGENGDLSFTIKAIADAVGNTIPDTTYAGGTDGYGKTIIVDTTVPTITVTEASSGTAQEKTVSAKIIDANPKSARYLISKSSICNESTLAASANSEPYTSGRAIVLDDEAQNGSYVCFRTIDVAGNVSFARSTQVTGIDTTAPTISITEARSGVQREKGISAIVSADADTSGTRYTISADDCDADLIGNDDDGKAYTSGNNVALDSEHYNEKYVCFRARDSAGNIVFARSSMITGIDRISPAIGNIHITTTGITANGVKYAKAGDIITGTVLIADSNLIALPEARIFSETTTGGTAMTVNRIDNGNYTLTHTVRPDDEDSAVQKIFVRAQDDADNVSTGTGTLGVVIDTAAPTVSVTAIPAGGSREKTVSATLSDVGSGILTSGTRYSISDKTCDKDLIASDTSGNSYTSGAEITLNDEAYNEQYVCFRARDKAGNVVFARSAKISGIDRTGPTISIIHPDGVTNTKTISVTISADAIAAGTRRAIIANGSCDEEVIGSDTEGDRYVSGSGIAFNSETYNGKYLCVRTRDAVGNISFARSKVITGIDRTNPVISTVSVTTDSAYESTYYAGAGDTITATLSVSDTNFSGLPTVKIFSENSTLGEAMQVTDNNDGTYTATYTVRADDEDRSTQLLHMEARDAAGNLSGRGVDIGVIIDTVDPVISVGSLATGAAQEKTLKAGITDKNIVIAGARYVISESACDENLISDNSSGNAYISGTDIDLNSEQHNGKYVCFRARDIIGNISFARSSVITGIDRSAPTISVTEPAEGAAREKTVAATITDANPVSVGNRYAISSEDCDADLIGSDTEGTAYTSGEEVTLNNELQNGQYVCFRARDEAGNVRFARSSVIDNIDRTEPTFGGVTITSSGSDADGTTYAGTGDTITVNAVIVDEHLGTDPVMRIFSSGKTSGESVTVNKGADGTYTGTYTIAVGDENRSPQRIYLQALDDAGNTDAWTSDITVTIDTGGPNITITEAATGAARTKTVSAKITDSSATETKYRIADEDCDTELFIGFNAQTYQSGESITLNDEVYNGQHICFRASDSAGNISFARSAQTTGIDRTGPTITTLGLTAGVSPLKVVSASITGIAIAIGSRYAITTEDCDSDLIGSDTDGTSYTAGNTINLDKEEYNGQHVCFRARDAVGNVSFTRSAQIDGIDRIKPSISITEPTSGAAQLKSISAEIEDTHLIAAASRYDITTEDCDADIIGSDTEGTAYTSGESITLDDEAYNGQYVCFRARDTVNNIVFARSARITGIDRTGPTVSVTNPAGETAREKSVSAAIAEDAATAGSRYAISSEDCDADLIGSDTEGAAYTSGEEVTLNNELQNGQYVCFRARDAVGNVSFTRSAQITGIDRTAPTVRVVDPAFGDAREKLVSAVITGDAVAESTRYLITSSACDAALISSNTDGELYASGTNIALNDEAYNGQYVCFRVSDAAGNVSFARSAQIADIDRTGPTITLNDPSTGAAQEKFVSAIVTDGAITTDTRYIISDASCDESLIGNSATGRPYISGATIILNDEAYNRQYVCFRARDAVGNVSFARSEQITGIDRTGPTVTVTDPVVGAAREKTVSAAIAEDAAITGSRYTIAGSVCNATLISGDIAGEAYTSGKSITLDDEAYNGQYVCFRARDAVGNVSFTRSAQITGIDRTAPTVRVVDPAFGDAREKLVSAVITGDAVAESTRYLITSSACDATLISSDADGELYASDTDITLDDESYNGQHVCFRARDAAGNVSFVRSARITDIDRTGPTITLNDPSTGAAQEKFVSAIVTDGAITTDTRYIISDASCDESLIGNSATGRPYTSGATIALNDETYNGQYACFRASDLVGNVSFARSEQITGIDRTPPVITTLGPSAGLARLKVASASATGLPVDTGTQYILSDGNCDSRLISSDSDGVNYTAGENIVLDEEAHNGHYVCFRARDEVGNIAFARSEQISGIDRTAPVITITEPITGEAQTKTVSATITGNVAAAGSRYRIANGACDTDLIGSDSDGEPYVPGADITLDNETYNGQYVCFRSADTVGNVSFARSEQITGIDRVGPTITLNNPASGTSQEKTVSAVITDRSATVGSQYAISTGACDASLIGSSADGQPYTSGTDIALDDESYNGQYICFRAADTVGNVSFARSEQITDIDRTPPVITPVGPEPGTLQVKVAAVSITGLAADAGNRYVITGGVCDETVIASDTDGEAYTPSGGIVLDDEAYNRQYVCFRARDAIGNVSFARSAQITGIDRSGPVITPFGPESGAARLKVANARVTGFAEAVGNRYVITDEVCDETVIASDADGEAYTSGGSIILDDREQNGRYICYRARDAIGNVSFARSQQINGIDTSGPSINVAALSGGTARIKNISAEITDLSLVATGTRYIISGEPCDEALIASDIDGELYIPGTNVALNSESYNGQHVCFRTRDAIGNIVFARSAQITGIDRTPPVITPFGPEPGTARLKVVSASVTGLAVDAGDRYVITDGACDETVIASDADGDLYVSGRNIVLDNEAYNGRYICYRARDEAGNVSFVRSLQIDGIDTTAPTIAVADLTTEPALVKSVSASITGDADVAKSRYIISGDACDSDLIRTDTDGELYTSGESIVLDDEAYNGQHVCFRAADTVGNISFTRSDQIIGIDQSGPVITPFGPEPGTARLKVVSASVTGLAVDAGDRYVITDGACDETVIASDADGDLYVSGRNIVLDNEAYNGRYICYRARDEIGNVSFARSAQITGIDRTGPVITPFGPTSDPARLKVVSASVTGLAVDAGDRYVITSDVCDETLIDSDTDGDLYTSGGSIVLDDEAYNGQYVCFRARDAVGNVSFARSARIIDIDTTPPFVGEIITNTSGTVNNTGKYAKAGDTINIVFSESDLNFNNALPTVRIFTGTDAIGTALSVTGVPGSYNASYIVQPDDENKPQQVSITVSDIPGNVTTSTQQLDIIIDTTAPAPPSAITLATEYDSGLSNSDGITNRFTDLTFLISAEPNTVAVLSDSGGASGVIGSDGTPATITRTLPEESRLIALTATATDIAGNTSQESEQFTVAIDVNSPRMQLSRIEDRNITGSEDIVIFGAPSDPPAAVDSVDTVAVKAMTKTECDALTVFPTDGDEYTPFTFYELPTTALNGVCFIVRDRAGNIGATHSNDAE